MELKNGPVSIFRLFLGAFQTANRAFGSAFVLFILIVFLQALIGGALYGASFISAGLVKILFIPAYILGAFLPILMSTALIQILAAKFEREGRSAWDSLTGSVLPALYFLISSLLLGVVTGAILFGATLTRSTPVLAAAAAAVILCTLPFIFTQHAAALRREGPLGALRYSWELGTAHYLRIIFTILCMALSAVIFILAITCALKAVAPQAQALLAQNNPLLLLFRYSKLQLAVGASVIILLYAYFMLAMQAVITGLFLNLDYSHRAAQSREIDLIATAAAPVAATAQMNEVCVTQASVRTQSDLEVEKNLDQVYRAQEHLAQALEQEEDRMPTILFDEAMARQLAESERQMQERKQKAAQKQQESGEEPIKISDKPL